MPNGSVLAIIEGGDLLRGHDIMPRIANRQAEGYACRKVGDQDVDHGRGHPSHRGGARRGVPHSGMTRHCTQCTVQR